MNSLVTRGSLFDDFFKDIAPGFYVRPLHGDTDLGPLDETQRASTLHRISGAGGCLSPGWPGAVLSRQYRRR